MAGESKPSPRSLKSLGLFSLPTVPSVPALDTRVPYGPALPPPPAPLAFLAPWLEGAVDVVRGGLWGSEGAGDTAAAKTAELLSAGLPLLPLKALGFFSRVDKAVDLIPAKGAHPNKVASLLKSNASAEELAYRNVPEFLAGKGNATVTRADLAAHLAAHPAPVPKVVTRGANDALKAEQAALTQQIEATRAQAFANLAPLGQLTQANAPWWAIEATSGGAPELTARALAKIDALPIPAEQKAAMLDFGRLSQQSSRLNEQVLSGQTKYENYTVPGGEAYRETLVTLPEAGEEGFQRLLAQRDEVNRAIEAHLPKDRYGQPDRFAAPEPALVQQYNAIQAKIDAMQHSQFRSGHFEEPNILVHTRANERTLPTGERGRFVEEVQSDWHQKGKKEGAQSPTPETGPALVAHTDIRLEEGTHSWMAFTPDGRKVEIGKGTVNDAADARSYAKIYFNNRAAERAEALRVRQSNQVPDAPFKEAWPELGLKQQLLETAADPDASWIGFTGGATQAARYDLSKQIGRVRYDADTHYLEAFDLADDRVIAKDGVTPEQLADYIGKDAAEKLLQQPRIVDPTPMSMDDTRYQMLSGLDLQVGGEGMRHFYDQVLPKRLEKILKPFGGTVERGTLGGRAKGEIDTEMDALTLAALDGTIDNEAYTTALNRLQAERNAAPEVAAESWFARLTPEMKERIRREGLPLLSLLPLGVLGNYGQQPTEPAR